MINTQEPSGKPGQAPCWIARQVLCLTITGRRSEDVPTLSSPRFLVGWAPLEFEEKRAVPHTSPRTRSPDRLSLLIVWSGRRIDFSNQFDCHAPNLENRLYQGSTDLELVKSPLNHCPHSPKRSECAAGC